MNLFRRFKRLVSHAAVASSRTQLGNVLIRFMVVNMSFALPVEKLRQTSSLLAFYHPLPAYKVHILIIPRRPVDNLLAIRPEDASFLVELFETVKSLVIELGLEKPGYRLIANGGAYQDFPTLHFHLVSGAVQDKTI